MIVVSLVVEAGSSSLSFAINAAGQPSQSTNGQYNAVAIGMIALLPQHKDMGPAMFRIKNCVMELIQFRSFF